MSDARLTPGVATLLQKGALAILATDVPVRSDLFDLHDAID